uniref:60S ribosomal protein L7a n=1 Tax=Brassica oleracea TaxID=3712 RepID=A0A3P6BY64_BRAOL|nr:unnamed protein product [Brassica oleracea]
MGVTFKISKTGQLNPKSIDLSEKSKAIVESSAGDASGFLQSSLLHVSSDYEFSFVLSLYLNGYSIGKPSEAVQQTSFRDAPKTLDKNIATQLFKVLMKYRPEDKAAKKDRLLKKAQAEAEGKPSESKKPIVVKYGLNHMTYLSEQNKAQIVVIAHDVDPIELVVWFLHFAERWKCLTALSKANLVLERSFTRRLLLACV